MLEKIPECILNMNFMNFDENFSSSRLRSIDNDLDDFVPLGLELDVTVNIINKYYK